MRNASKGARWFWVLILAFGLLLLGVGLVFYFSGPEMIVLTVLFGAAGIFLVFESVGRVLGWEK